MKTATKIVLGSLATGAAGIAGMALSKVPGGLAAGLETAIAGIESEDPTLGFAVGATTVATGLLPGRTKVLAPAGGALISFAGRCARYQEGIIGGAEFLGELVTRVGIPIALAAGIGYCVAKVWDYATSKPTTTP